MSPHDDAIRHLLPDHGDYPPLLREIPLPPRGIYLRGALPAPDRPVVAIVGTRRATPDGLVIAMDFGRELAKAGIVIVSGLAFGVDAAAHRGCLAAEGIAIAVLPGGIDRCYPPAHRTLANDILRRGGALVSEYPPGELPFRARFLERNRIVSGLARGVVVIEAPERSGSLVTARFALEQNRDVFVVPGPARHPHFKGSHALIRAGAELITEPAQVMEALGIAPAGERAADLTLTPTEQAVAAALRRSPGATIDKIISLTHLEAHTVNSAVAMLFARSIIDEVNGVYHVNN